MTSVTVSSVQTRRQRQQFLDLPAAIYRGDPHWIPALRMNVKELVGYAKHPFHAENEVQTFLATRDGEVVGRIATIVNEAHIARYSDRRGFFGFFESIDDQAVANALFDTARTWFAERNIQDMRGPTNPSLNYECGLLVDGFDSAPFFMMTYNPSYYPRLIENYGFRKAQDMYAFWGHVEMLKDLDKKLEFVINEATRRFNAQVRPLDSSRFNEEVRTFLNLYNQSLGGTWGFAPMSDGEIAHLAKGLKMLIVPELTSVA